MMKAAAQDASASGDAAHKNSDGKLPGGFIPSEPIKTPPPPVPTAALPDVPLPPLVPSDYSPEGRLHNLCCTGPVHCARGARRCHTCAAFAAARVWTLHAIDDSEEAEAEARPILRFGSAPGGGTTAGRGGLGRKWPEKKDIESVVSK